MWLHRHTAHTRAGHLESERRVVGGRQWPSGDADRHGDGLPHAQPGPARREPERGADHAGHAGPVAGHRLDRGDEHARAAHGDRGGNRRAGFDQYAITCTSPGRDGDLHAAPADSDRDARARHPYRDQRASDVHVGSGGRRPAGCCLAGCRAGRAAAAAANRVFDADGVAQCVADCAAERVAACAAERVAHGAASARAAGPPPHRHAHAVADRDAVPRYPDAAACDGDPLTDHSVARTRDGDPIAHGHPGATAPEPDARASATDA
ncbi:MAG: hypothetical protein JOZ87_34770 [Chloroflexi bacterium]|nr:hypothetical protein [Chloroflexota bacterium]